MSLLTSVVWVPVIPLFFPGLLDGYIGGWVGESVGGWIYLVSMQPLFVPVIYGNITFFTWSCFLYTNLSLVIAPIPPPLPFRLDPEWCLEAFCIYMSLYWESLQTTYNPTQLPLCHDWMVAFDFVIHLSTVYFAQMSPNSIFGMMKMFQESQKLFKFFTCRLLMSYFWFCLFMIIFTKK